MTEIQNPKRENDLEERTFQFAKAVRLFVKTLPKRFFHQFLKNQSGLNLKSKPVWVIVYCNLKFICHLVLVI